MKNFFIAAISMAFVSSAFAQLQPKGTWYLGTANAPEALNIFSDGLDMTPSIGYAISDNVVLTLDLGVATTTDDLYGLLRPDSAVTTTITPVLVNVYEPDVNGEDSLVGQTVAIDTTTTVSYFDTEYDQTNETRKTNFALGVQYFFDDNYFVRGSIHSSTHTMTYTNDVETIEVETNSFGYSIGAGKFIAVRDHWYLSPELRYTGMNAGEDSSTGDLSFRIGLGLRF